MFSIQPICLIIATICVFPVLKGSQEKMDKKNKQEPPLLTRYVWNICNGTGDLIYKNFIDGVMVNILTMSAVDHGFWSDPTKDCKIGICFFLL